MSEGALSGLLVVALQQAVAAPLAQSTGWFRLAPIAADEWITALYHRICETWRYYLATCTALPLCDN